MTNKKYYPTFYGQKLSDYALEHGRVDYLTLSKCFGCVLCNNIPSVDTDIWDNLESGSFTSYYFDGEEITEEEYEEKEEQLEDAIMDIDFLDFDKLSEEEQAKQNQERERLTKELEKLEKYEQEIYQYYIVEDSALHLLREAGEIVFYSEKLDCYIWGVTHWGTSWDYVLTSIKLDPIPEEEQRDSLPY